MEYSLNSFALWKGQVTTLKVSSGSLFERRMLTSMDGEFAIMTRWQRKPINFLFGCVE